MSDAELRMAILRYLQDNEPGNPHDELLASTLNVDIAQIRRALSVLEAQGHITGNGLEDGSLANIKIEGKGRLALEESASPSRSVAGSGPIINIHGNVSGTSMMVGGRDIGSGNVLTSVADHSQVDQYAQQIRSILDELELQGTGVDDLKSKLATMIEAMKRPNLDVELVAAHAESFIDKVIAKGLALSKFVVPLKSLLGLLPPVLDAVKHLPVLWQS